MACRHLKITADTEMTVIIFFMEDVLKRTGNVYKKGWGDDKRVIHR